MISKRGCRTAGYGPAFRWDLRQRNLQRDSVSVSFATCSVDIMTTRTRVADLRNKRPQPEVNHLRK
jgi:hypothetical protein